MPYFKIKNIFLPLFAFLFFWMAVSGIADCHRGDAGHMTGLPAQGPAASSAPQDCCELHGGHGADCCHVHFLAEGYRTTPRHDGALKGNQSATAAHRSASIAGDRKFSFSFLEVVVAPLKRDGLRSSFSGASPPTA